MFPACATLVLQCRAAAGPRPDHSCDEQRPLARPHAIRRLQHALVERPSRRAFLLSAGAAPLLLHGSAAALGLRSVNSKVGRSGGKYSVGGSSPRLQHLTTGGLGQPVPAPAAPQAPAVITFRNELDRTIKIYWVRRTLAPVHARRRRGRTALLPCGACVSFTADSTARPAADAHASLVALPGPLDADQLHGRCGAVRPRAARRVVHSRHVREPPLVRTGPPPLPPLHENATQRPLALDQPPETPHRAT